MQWPCQWWSWGKLNTDCLWGIGTSLVITSQWWRIPTNLVRSMWVDGGRNSTSTLHYLHSATTEIDLARSLTTIPSLHTAVCLWWPDSIEIMWDTLWLLMVFSSVLLWYHTRHAYTHTYIYTLSPLPSLSHSLSVRLPISYTISFTSRTCTYSSVHLASCITQLGEFKGNFTVCHCVYCE